MRDLLRDYADQPMDYADATLVVLADHTRGMIDEARTAGERALEAP